MKKGFVLLLIVLLTGCTRPIEDVEVDMSKLEEISFTEYDIPLELKNKLIEEEISGIYVIEDRTYISYHNNHETGGFIALDSEFNIIYEVNGLGATYEVKNANDGNILVRTVLDHRYYFHLYDSLGTEISGMNADNDFYSYGIKLQDAYLYLGDGSYIFIEETVNEENERAFQVVKVSKNEEVVVLFDIGESNYPNAYILSNDSFVLLFKKANSSLESLVHLDTDGVVIHNEVRDISHISILRDGYLIQNMAYNEPSEYIIKDNNSETIAELATTKRLLFKEEKDSTLVFRVFNDDEFEEIIYDDSMNVISTKEIDPHNVGVIEEYELNDDKTLYELSGKLSGLWQYSYKFIHKVDDVDFVTIAYYWYKTDVIVKDELLYIHGKEEDIYEIESETTIDIYNFSGEKLSTVSIDGTVLYVKENGNFIVRESLSVISEIDSDNNILWSIDIELDDSLVRSIEDYYDIRFSEHENNVFEIEGLYQTIPTAFPAPEYETFILIDDDGDILLDCSNNEDVHFVYNNDNYILTYFGDIGQLHIYDYDNRLIDEYDIVHYKYNVYYAIKEDKLVKIEF